MGEILTTTQGRVRIVTIQNERKRNAVTRAMEPALHDAFEDAESDPNVRVVIIVGAGDIAFSSGHDLTELGGEKGPRRPDPMHRPALMAKPMIAAVNGHCHAAGLVMALGCDIRVASENAIFGSPAVKLGQMAMGGQLWRLPSLMPRGRAVEMLLTGEMLTAAQAFEFGLATHLVPVGQALTEALKIAEKIAANSPASIRAIKQGLKLIETEGIRNFERYEIETQERLAAGPDAKEGMKAFAEKRRPNFG